MVRDGNRDLAGRPEPFGLTNEEISLLDISLLETVAQFVEGGRCPRGEHEPRGFGVEAVHEAGLARRMPDAGHLGVPAHERIGQRARFAVSNRRRRLTGRFLDDDQFRRFDPNVELGIRLGDGVGTGDVGQRERHVVALSRDVALLGRLPLMRTRPSSKRRRAPFYRAPARARRPACRDAAPPVDPR